MKIIVGVIGFIALFVLFIALFVLFFELYKRAGKFPPELISPNEAQELARKFGLLVMPEDLPAYRMMQIFEVAHTAVATGALVSRTAEFVEFYNRLRRTIVAWAHEGSPFV